MDVETSEAIERINDSVVELRTELHDGLASVRMELQNGLAGVRMEIAAVRTELRAEIREGVAEAKRHAQILHEDLKDDIRIVAEGVAHLSARRDSGPQ